MKLMNWEKHFPISQLVTRNNITVLIMKPRSVFFYNRANSEKIRMSAKVWKVQIELPCGFCLKENVAGDKPAKLTIYQILN